MQILRLFGTPVRMDWTWIVVFALFAWIFSAQIAGFIALGMFAALLVHEIAHAITARANCIERQYTVLFPFGGAHHSEASAETPVGQAIVAGTAPVVSLALSAAFALVALLFEPDTAAFVILASFSVIFGVVAAVNALPVYPFDGGRLLHAFLWHITGNADRTSGLVAALSALVGWCFACAAVALTLTGNVEYGVACSVLAWFIMRPVQTAPAPDRDPSERTDVQTRCIDLMDRPGTSLQPDVTCAEAWTKLISSGQRSAPIAVGRKFIGILALSDFAKLGDRDPHYVYVSVIMTPAERLVTLEPATPGSEALQRLFESGYHQLPVVGKTGALLGFINRKSPG